tara:strand:- start:55066 stop:57228 length:2163 start_codon:yes stop_codon:yes gene_type:complete
LWCVLAQEAVVWAGKGHQHSPDDGHGHAKAKKTPTAGKKAKAEYLDPVVVTGTRTRRRVSDTPVKTEVVTAQKIESKGTRNLVEALAGEPGIRLDNQCSVCNTTGLRLSGLPGRYLLVMIDGLPIFSSLGLTYGLLQVDTMNIKQIEVVKGANSVLYGTDAISGVVNIITKTPKQGGEGSAAFELGSFGSRRLAGYSGFRQKSFSLGLTASYTTHDRVDRDGDGVSEYTGFDRINATATMRYSFAAQTSMQLQFSFMNENRLGGAAKGSILEIQSDFRPDAAPSQGETFGRRALSEAILTTRWGGGLKFRHSPNEWLTITTSLTAIQHEQDSDYEGDVYVGQQLILFAQQAFQINILNQILLQTGVTYRYEGLVENKALSEYQYHMPGAYAQAEWLVTRWLEVVGGFRYDWHNQFGHVPTPRVAFKLAPIRGLTFRGVWGTGFRAPSTFYEYAHGARPQGYKLVNEATRPETSNSANLSITYTPGAWLSLTIEGAWNRIAAPITFEVLDQSAGQGREGDVRVFNADGQLEVLSLEVQAQSTPFPWLQINAGYGFYEYTNQDVLVSAAPKHHITFGFDVRVPKAQTRISLTGEVFLPMDLKGVYGDGYRMKGTPSLEKWLDPSNADTTQRKLASSPTYGLVNLKIEQDLASLLRPFGIRAPANVSLYFGIDNLLDFHQSDIDGPIFFPAGPNGVPGPADIIYIWGPMRGRFFYGGLKISTR